MRKVEFCVPSPVMVEFCEEILNSNLNNSITGTTDEDEIIIEIEYGKDESKVVDKLEELLETLCEQLFISGIASSLAEGIKRKTALLGGLSNVVGATGFEPVTPCL